VVSLEPGWHPLVVHFPIALTLTAGVLLIAAKFVRKETLAATLATIGTWNLCLGAVAVLFALATGLAGVLDLQVSAAAHAAIAAHVKWAMFTSLALLLTAVWRGAGSAQQSRPSGLFLVVLTLMCMALAVTGYHGGENVYRYGVGVERGNQGERTN
jgi:uncharacterized membrane protein